MLHPARELGKLPGDNAGEPTCSRVCGRSLTETRVGRENHLVSERGTEFPNLRALGLSVLAGLLYLLLLDAAVETLGSRPSVGWWVALVVAVYVGGSVVLWWRAHPLWQRIGWPNTGMISFFVLLGLLAVTAWLPGGLSNGLTLLRLSTSTLLSLATAAAVALSGIVLFQLRYPHPAIKWTIAVLTAYGILAFLHGIVTGSWYVGLLHGASLWTELPFLLQGAFIGAVIAVPVAIMVEALRLFRDVAKREWRLQQTWVLAISLVMTVSGLTTGSISTGYPTLAQYAPKKPSGVIKAVSLSSSESNRFAPARVSTKFAHGVKEVMIWYRWEGAIKGHRVDVRWSKNGSVVLTQGEFIQQPSGSVSWFLARNKGEPLPAGMYQVELRENGELVTAIPFRIGD